GDHRLRILVYAIDTEFKVQVRACGPTGRTHGANVLALLNGLALFDVNATQVGIHSHVAGVGVFDKNHIAKAILPTGKLNHAITHRTYLGASGCRVVGAQVAAPSAVDRVFAHGKVAADARELHGRLQIGAAQAGAVHG